MRLFDDIAQVPDSIPDFVRADFEYPYATVYADSGEGEVLEFDVNTYGCQRDFVIAVRDAARRMAEKIGCQWGDNLL